MKLHYECQGHGTPVVLLHGFTGSLAGMGQLAGELGTEYEVIAIDLPGHGKSDAPPEAGYGFNACVDDLVGTLLAAGHERAHWLGYSMGGRLALGCAARHPDSVISLMLVGARAGIADADERAARRSADEALAERIERLGLETFVDRWMAQPLLATQRRLGANFLAAARADRLAGNAAGLAASLRCLGPGAQPPLFDALGGITVPTLLVAGELDRPFVEAAQQMAARMPNATACVIDDAGHAAHLEQARAVLNAAKNFLCLTNVQARETEPSYQETAS